MSVLRGLDVNRLRAHEFSSYGANFEFLTKHCTDFTFSEYFPGKARVVNGIRNEDITNLTFPSNSIDLLTSNGVMEHVPEDVQGYCECHRVLKPGGVLVFSVPLYDTPESVKLASVSGDGIVWHGTPEYHDSRLQGPFSAPTFWRHSWRDMCDRVRRVGFSSVELVDVILSPAQGEPSRVVKAVK